MTFQRSCRWALSPLRFCVSRFWFLREFRFPWFQYFTLSFLSNKRRELLFSPRRLQGWCVCVNSRHLRLWQLLWQGAFLIQIGQISLTMVINFIPTWYQDCRWRQQHNFSPPSPVTSVWKELPRVTSWWVMLHLYMLKLGLSDVAIA